jgi:hypothetical protein
MQYHANVQTSAVGRKKKSSDKCSECIHFPDVFLQQNPMGPTQDFQSSLALTNHFQVAADYVNTNHISRS